MHPSSWCVRYCCFSAQAPRGTRSTRPLQLHRFGSDRPRSSKRAKVATANLQWPASDDHHPMKCSNVSENGGFIGKNTTWNSWGPWPAGRVFFFLNGWDSTILSAGVMEYHGHCGKHVEESSCIPATLAVDCKIIKEPWATPDRATPTSCYSFKKNAKNRKTLKKKTYPKIQKKTENSRILCGMKWNYLELKQMKTIRNVPGVSLWGLVGNSSKGPSCTAPIQYN